MDKFLQIVYMSQIGDSEKGDAFVDIFKPFTEKLESMLNEKLYRELDELFTYCAVECAEYYAVEGMKLALEIKQGTYIPTI